MSRQTPIGVHGFFYGPGAGFNPDADVAQQMRQQQFSIAGNGEDV